MTKPNRSEASVERRKIKAREWYLRNREAVLASKREQNERIREHRAQQARGWRKANPEIAREVGRRHHLKKKYGLTTDQWGALFLSQGQCCAICRSETPGDKRNWHTDHCHDTGKVRGILCSNCNRIVHKLATPEVLRRAAEYVRSHHDQNQ